MATTTLRQKIFFLFFSLFLTAVLLEIGLRIGGAVVLFLQEKHNHPSLLPDHCRILCLGESTTALGGEDSYPSQLERILNQQSRGMKFTVINKGLISTTSDYIVTHVEQNLNLYKPQMVVIMMGINDASFARPSQIPLWLWKLKSSLQDLRVYKLLHLLKRHITHRIREATQQPNPEKSQEAVNTEDLNGQKENFIKKLIATELTVFQTHLSAAKEYANSKNLEGMNQEKELAKKAAISASAACVDLARRYLKQGLLTEALEYLIRATTLNSGSSDAFQLWGEYYLSLQNAPEAIAAYQKALSINSQDAELLQGMARAYHLMQRREAFLLYMEYLKKEPHDYWGYIELAQWFKENKYFDQAQVVLKQAIAIGPFFERGYLDQGQLLEEQGDYQDEQEMYLKAVALNAKKSSLLLALGEFYQRRGRADLADEYLKKAEKMGLEQFPPGTWVDYDDLLNKILSRGIKVIVLQYPVRSIAPLKNYLGQRKNVTFVENRLNFKHALESGRYSDYFTDNFAYDFGHCTRRGNQLIAQKIADEILKILTGTDKPTR